MKTIAALLAVASLALASTSADAKGCLKGAAVGGVAGHYAGHHGVLGAVDLANEDIRSLLQRALP